MELGYTIKADKSSRCQRNSLAAHVAVEVNAIDEVEGCGRHHHLSRMHSQLVRVRGYFSNCDGCIKPGGYDRWWRNEITSMHSYLMPSHVSLASRAIFANSTRQ